MLALEEWFCRGSVQTVIHQSFYKFEVTCLSNLGRVWSLGRCGRNSARVRWAVPKQKQCKGTEDDTLWSGRGTVCWMEGGGFIFHCVTDRFTFISINPIIEVDLFSPAMQFQLTNPASPSFLQSVTVKQGHSINFWLVFQRKWILCNHGDCQPWLISTTIAGGIMASGLLGLLCILCKIWPKR